MSRQRTCLSGIFHKKQASPPQDNGPIQTGPVQGMGFGVTRAVEKYGVDPAIGLGHENQANMDAFWPDRGQEEGLIGPKIFSQNCKLFHIVKRQLVRC